MRKSSSRILPAYVTLRPSDLVTHRGDSWKKPFPFSARYGLWTFSGRVALHVGLKRLGLKQGSTLLVPSYFQGVEIDTLIANGFKLEFYRLDERLQPDLEHIESLLDESISALYVIHYFGFPQPVRRLFKFCKKKGIKMIEDCALSLFSRDGDAWLGTEGDMAIFSVYKTVPLPHGGYLVTKKEPSAVDELEKPPLISTTFQTTNLFVRHVECSWPRVGKGWRSLSRPRRALAGDVPISGRATWNSSALKYGASPIVPRLMTAVDPALVIQRRRENYQHLHTLLAGAVPTVFGELPPGVCPLFYPVMVKDKVRIKELLAARGIETVNLWSQPHPACPPERAEEAAVWRRHLLEVPIHHQLDIADVDRIGRALFEVVLEQEQGRPITLVRRQPLPTGSPPERGITAAHPS